MKDPTHPAVLHAYVHSTREQISPAQTASGLAVSSKAYASSSRHTPVRAVAPVHLEVATVLDKTQRLPQKQRQTFTFWIHGIH